MAETTIAGILPRDLSNAVSDAIHDALERGMGPDEAVCVALSVAVDYGRAYYGDEYAKKLAALVLKIATAPIRGVDVANPGEQP